MSGTSVRYLGNVWGRSIEVQRDGRVISTLPLGKLTSLDGDLATVEARAMETPGVWIPVPAISHARGVRPRNYGAMGVRQ